MRPMGNKHRLCEGESRPAPGLLITLCSIRHVPAGAGAGAVSPGDDALALRHRLKYAAFARRAATRRSRNDAPREQNKTGRALSAKLAVNDSRNRCTTRAPTYRKLRTGPDGDTPIPIKIQFESGIHLSD